MPRRRAVDIGATSQAVRRLRWLLTANNVTQTDAAAALLSAALKAGPLPQRLLLALWRGAGIRDRFARYAKQRLHVTSRRVGGWGERGAWLWQLPV